MKCNRFLNVLIILGIFVCNCTSCENSMENSVKVKSIKGSKIGETIEPLERHSLFTDSKPIDKNDETNFIFVEF